MYISGDVEQILQLALQIGAIKIVIKKKQVRRLFRTPLGYKKSAQPCNKCNPSIHLTLVFVFFSDIPIKNSPLDYKSNSSCSSPSKILENHQQKNTERCSLPLGSRVPVLPVRNNLRRPNSSHFPPARFQFRKGFTKCSWRCTAIVFIILSVVLLAAVTYMSSKCFERRKKTLRSLKSNKRGKALRVFRAFVWSFCESSRRN